MCLLGTFPPHLSCSYRKKTRHKSAGYLFSSSFIMFIQKKTLQDAHVDQAAWMRSRMLYQSFPHSVKTVCILLLLLNQSTRSAKNYLNLIYWGRMYFDSVCKKTRVKSGRFGHQVNSDTHLQTVSIQMRRLLMRHQLMSRLIRIFTVCLVTRPSSAVRPVRLWPDHFFCPKWF